MVGVAERGLHKCVASCRGLVARGSLCCRARGHMILAVLASIVLISCTPNLIQMRHENAAAVLHMYRTKPLQAVSNGKDVLTVDDCIQLALANSLDVQVALWEEQIRGGLAKSASVRMLPRLEGFYEQSARDRPLWSRSDVIDQEGAWEVVGPESGTGVTNWSTARERGQRTWNAQVKWSPMDACMASYLARVKTNEGAHARYQRVRVAQQLIGTTTGAFYRLLALTEALPKARAVESNRRAVVRDLAALDESAMADKQELISARAQLTEASSQLSDMFVNIEKQKELLTAAMHVSPGSCFSLAGSLIPAPTACLDPCKLEADALVNRPETYQADLTFLSSIEDQKRLIVKLFPRVEAFYGYFRDENKFLLNKNWWDGGMRVTWELMDFTATLLEKGVAGDRILKTDRERALISVGILTQVKLRMLDALRNVEKFRRNSELADHAGEALRIAKDTEEAKERGAPQRVMRIARQKALCNLLQAEVDRILALGEAQASFGELAAATGTNYPVATAHPTPGPDPLQRAAMQSTLGAHQVAEGVKKVTDFVATPVRHLFGQLPKPW
jgi:hypothetical protein